MRAELETFLALEAPFLLPIIRRLNARTFEAGLLEAIGELQPVDAQASIHPGLDAGRAAADVRDALSETVRGFFRRAEIRASLTADERLRMYRTMVLTRAVDTYLKNAFDTQPVRWEGKPSPQKGFRSWGQEALVGVACRLRPTEDIIGPVIRDLPVLLMFTDDPLPTMLVQAGKKGTPMDGRDLHIGDLTKGVLPPTAPLAISTQTLIGISYADKLDGRDRVCVSFIGEGGSSLGEWHEAINFAAVRKLAMVFVLENNQWALGTHVSEQSAAKRFALKAAGYGMPGVTINGQDPDAIAAAAAWAADRARAGQGPALVEIVSYRMGGHAHHDDVRFHQVYDIKEERTVWEAHDPIAAYGARLKSERVLSDAKIRTIDQDAARRLVQAARAVESAPWPTPDDAQVSVFAPRETPATAAPEATRDMTYDEALRTAIIEQMESDPRVFVLGEDVGGRYGGAFAVTRGMAKQFGPQRVLNTPIAESAIIGCAVGAALMGKRPVAEIQFADFLAPAFNALVNNAPKIYWRWRRPVPMVVRLPYGGATADIDQKMLGGGPFHSQCPEAWFLRTPGWKIVAPGTPRDAKGLMAAAIRDNNPVIYLEAKGLYGVFPPKITQPVPIGADFEVPIGVAHVRRPGRDITLLTYGAMIYVADRAAEALAREGIEIEVIDLRTLVPLDEEAILQSVARTHRVLILHEDSKRGGVGAELAAIIAERVLFELDAPIVRVAAPDHPPPYSPPLEYGFLPKPVDVVTAARGLMNS